MYTCAARACRVSSSGSLVMLDSRSSVEQHQPQYAAQHRGGSNSSSRSNSVRLHADQAGLYLRYACACLRVCAHAYMRACTQAHELCIRMLECVDALASKCSCWRSACFKHVL